MTDSLPNAWLPQPLRVLAGRALETALNHLLSLDPDTAGALGALHGRQLELHLKGAELALAITVDGDRLRVGPLEPNASLRVAARPSSLLGMLLGGGSESLAPGKVEIAGDAELARRLEKLARQFAPDFEEAVTRSLGDVLGVPIARALGQALSRAREGASHFRQDSADWLRDEARLAVAPGEADDFLDGVDRLRERTERFEARLARLERQRKGPTA